MSDNPQRTVNDILKDLHEFLSGPEEDFATLPIRKIDAVLDEAGVDARKTVRAVQDLLARSRATERLSAGRRKQELVSRLIAAYKRKSPVDDIAAKGKEALERLAAFSPGQEAVAFHKLEQATEEDLATLTEDLDLLEALDQGHAELDES